MAVVISLAMAAATGCSSDGATPTPSAAPLWSAAFHDSLCQVLVEAPALADRYDDAFDRAVAAQDAERVAELWAEVLDEFSRLSDERPRSFEWPDSSALIASLEERLRDWRSNFSAYHGVVSWAGEGIWNADHAQRALSDADAGLAETAAAYRDETLTEYEALRADYGFECEAL